MFGHLLNLHRLLMELSMLLKLSYAVGSRIHFVILAFAIAGWASLKQFPVHGELIGQILWGLLGGVFLLCVPYVASLPGPILRRGLVGSFTIVGLICIAAAITPLWG